jgi:uncharacterized protein
VPISRSDLIPLLDLQRIDEALTRIAKTLKELPEDVAVKTAVAEREELVPVHQESSEEFARLQREQQRLEDEIATLRTKLTRDQDRLASGTVTSPREIVNLQAEIDAIGKHISSLEDDELEVMELSEAVGKTLATIQSSLSVIDERIADLKRQRDQAAAALTADQTRLQNERAEKVGLVLPDVAARYDKLRAQIGGIVVAEYRSGSCGGCGLPLSPLAREEYRSSGEVWYPCENCRRILVEV